MAEKSILVSVIIPAKNEEKCLPLCLQGINNICYDRDRIEVIVVDNDSTDSTARIAEKFGAKVVMKKNGSIGSLRNHGARIASGKIIGFVDADCVVPRDWLKTALPHFSNKKVCTVGSPETWYGEKPTWVEKGWCELKNSFHPRKSWQKVEWCPSGTVLIKKEEFIDVGGFNEEIVTCEDADLSYRLGQKFELRMDYSIPTQHMRGSKNIRELFLRELWRGQANIGGRKVLFKELYSIAGPILFGCFLGGSIFSLMLWLIFNQTVYGFVSLSLLFLLCLMPALMLIKKRWHLAKKHFFQYYSICFVYLTARFFAIIIPGKRKW